MMTTSVSFMLASRRADYVRHSGMVHPGRQQPAWMDLTRNLEIPGSCFARPGMTATGVTRYD